jgi:hypothetical protein
MIDTRHASLINLSLVLFYRFITQRYPPVHKEMRTEKFLYRTIVLLIVQSLSLCVFLPPSANRRPAKTYHVFRGYMPNYSRQLHQDQTTSGAMLCLEKCGDRYFVCSVENCSPADDACNQYCTSVFRDCYKTCTLESPAPVPIQPHPNGKSRDDAISVTTGSWIFNETLYKKIHAIKSSKSQNDTKANPPMPTHRHHN